MGGSVGSAALPTVERLRAAAGSEMLPDEQAATWSRCSANCSDCACAISSGNGRRIADVLEMQRVSPIDRRILSRTIREVAAVQRRMDTIAVCLAVDEWTARQDVDS